MAGAPRLPTETNEKICAQSAYVFSSITRSTTHTEPMVLPRFFGPTVSRHNASPTVQTKAELTPWRTRAIVRTGKVLPTNSRTVARSKASRHAIRNHTCKRTRNDRCSCVCSQKARHVALNLLIRHTDFVFQDRWQNWYYQGVEKQVGE
jgi:hypothetical protein